MVDYAEIRKNIKWPRGIKAIPRFDGYGITRKGVVYYHDPFMNTFLIKAATTTEQGYAVLRLGKYGHQKIHRLLLMAYNRLPEKWEVCRHLDGNPQNNDLKNLKWGTQKENMQDMVRHGTGSNPVFYGEDHPNCKITDKDLQIMIDMCEVMSASEVAKIFGVTDHHVRAVVRGDKRKNFKGRRK